MLEPVLLANMTPSVETLAPSGSFNHDLIEHTLVHSLPNP